MASFRHYNVNNEEQVPSLSTGVDLELGRFIPNLQESLKINVIKLNDEEIVFDLIGVDASIANALRRILIAEVPTVAIETVFMLSNTSIIQDEVLAHRLGLIPLKIDPTKLEYKQDADAPGVESDTILLKLNVKCPPPPASYTPDQKLTYSYNVYSREITFVPVGNQEELFPNGIRPVHDDILIAVLRPGQEINFEAHAVKGIGKDHAKFSPVATASYRLLPEIVFPNGPVTGEDAAALQKMCPMGVFDIEDIKGKGSTAKTARPRDCTMCRECTRHDGWSNKVNLRRIADHYIFTVESSGSIAPEQIVHHAIEVLKEKATKFIIEVDHVM